MRTRLATAIAAWLSLAATAAHAGQAAQLAPCLSPQESEAFVIVVASPAIRETAKLCMPTLGTASYLGTHADALAGRFEAEAARSWPVAIGAITKVAKTEVADPEMVKLLVATLIAPALIGKLKPETCLQIDRALGYLDPLPARNAAGLAVQILQLMPRKSGKPLPICPAATN